jgi:anti-sigma regulatory factor (Ser/Thr protein kinase)
VRYDATFPAVPLAVGEIRHEVAAFARQCGFDEPQLAAVALAVSEASTNAIVHGYRGRPGAIRVSAAIGDGELTVVVADDGCGLVPRTDSQGLGLGLPIMASVARRVEFVAEGGGTQVHLVFPCLDEAAA